MGSGVVFFLFLLLPSCCFLSGLGGITNVIIYTRSLDSPAIGPPDCVLLIHTWT